MSNPTYDYKDMRDVYMSMRMFGTPSQHRYTAASGDTPFAQYHHDDGRVTLEPYNVAAAEAVVTNRVNGDFETGTYPYVTMQPRTEDWIQTYVAGKCFQEYQNPRVFVTNEYTPPPQTLAPTSAYLEDRKKDVARINYMNEQYVKARLASLNLSA